MYISNLVIKNFRNIKDICMDFPPQTIIVGENSIGKSNILHALRLVLDPTLPNSERQLGDEDFNSSVKFRGQSIEIEIRLKGFRCQEQVYSLLCDYLEQFEPEPIALLKYVYRRKESIKPEDAIDASSYRWAIVGPKKPDSKGSESEVPVRQTVLQMIQIAHLGALRDVASDLSSWRKSPLRPLIEQIKLPKNLLESVVTDIKKAAAPVLGYSGIIDLNQEIVDRLVDMVGDEYGFDPKIDISSTTADRLLRLLTLLAEGGRTADETSTGLANVLYIALWLTKIEQQKKLFRKGQGQDEPTSTILAFEEPEAHLHPHLQRLVFRTLFSAKRLPRLARPLFVTTHSPHITSVAPLDSIVRLSRYDDNVIATSAMQVISQFSGQERDALERFLDVTRNEVLFAKRIILVEGIAEQFIVTRFAEMLYQNPGSEFDSRVLDKLGITVCVIQSTNFEPFVRLLGPTGFRIPFVVLTDGDPYTSKRGNKEYAGISRAIKLARWIDQSIVEDLIRYKKSADWVSARASLATAGIFVNEVTLEADLWESGAQGPIINTLQQTGVSRSLLAKFRANMTSADLSPSERAEMLIKRIELSGGKGWFAQTLAPMLNLEHMPQYIADVLRHLAQDWKKTEQVI
jgi:putative ATP-dependent endonuclease of OLD family